MVVFHGILPGEVQDHQRSIVESIVLYGPNIPKEKIIISGCDDMKYSKRYPLKVTVFNGVL